MESRARRSRPGLSREAFEILLATLDPVRERAGERYEGIRARLLRFFLCRGGPRPEELADETIDRVCRKLAAGEVIRGAEAGPYFLGVARNVAREAWDREQRRREVGLTLEAAGQARPAPAAPEDEAALACLERCLATLPPERREILLRYYDNGAGPKSERRRALAGELGVGANALRIRLHRLRAQLEACVRQCLGDRETIAPAKPLPHRGTEDA